MCSAHYTICIIILYAKCWMDINGYQAKSFVHHSPIFSILNVRCQTCLYFLCAFDSLIGSIKRYHFNVGLFIAKPNQRNSFFLMEKSNKFSKRKFTKSWMIIKRSLLIWLNHRRTLNDSRMRWKSNWTYFVA